MIALPGSGYRMYYSQILPRPGFPAGANDYDNSTTRILSAFSADGDVWTPEPGVRLSPQAGGAGEFRVVSSEVVPVGDGWLLRMYYECCAGLIWHKDTGPVLSPGSGGWDAAKCSEMCVICLPQREDTAPRYRMFYEACDGTAKDERGVWRIASATSVAGQNSK